MASKAFSQDAFLNPGLLHEEHEEFIHEEKRPRKASVYDAVAGTSRLHFPAVPH
jgi:hypothetical protein